jgi:UDP-3-O-[3-hydroxymyristoyl] glucosamine N-acyltransferase
MKKHPTSIGDLVTLTGKASSWRSARVGDTVLIYHYSTLMAEVREGALVQVSVGWGSMTDKCGMAKLRRAATQAGLDIRSEV